MFLAIITTILGCSGHFISFIISMILQITSKESSYEKQLRQEIVELRRQLQNVSMVDQFAAYARLQRKINSLTAVYQGKVSERQSSIQQVKLVLKAIFHGNLIIISIWMVWHYQNIPVVSLPASLLWPLTPILSFPSCQAGDISVMIWLAIVRTASGQFIKIMNSNSNKNLQTADS